MKDSITTVLAIAVAAVVGGLLTFAIGWAISDSVQWRCVRYSGATGECVIMQRVDYYDEAQRSPAEVSEDAS